MARENLLRPDLLCPVQNRRRDPAMVQKIVSGMRMYV